MIEMNPVALRRASIEKMYQGEGQANNYPNVIFRFLETAFKGMTLTVDDMTNSLDYFMKKMGYDWGGDVKEAKGEEKNIYIPHVWTYKK